MQPRQLPGMISALIIKGMGGYHHGVGDYGYPGMLAHGWAS